MPIIWQDKYRDKIISAKEAAKIVKSGERVVLAMMDMPKLIGFELAKRKDELQNVTLISHWTDDFPWFQPGWEDSFLVEDAFPLAHTRPGVKERRFDWVPSIFGLNDGVRQEESDRTGIYHYADVFLGKVSPPDEEGYCSFGPRLWYSPSALKTARTVIVEVDPTITRVFGDRVHISEIDYLVETEPVPADKAKSERPLPVPPVDEWEKAQVIAANVSTLIRDGDTLQIGTGTASEAITTFLEDRNDLGIDSEIIPVSLLEAIRKGVFTNKRKSINRGKSVCACLRTYDNDPATPEILEFVRENPAFEFRDVGYICNVPRIASNDNMVSINTGLAIDLLGQLVIDHLGPVPISGPGGQVEFCIGAHYSKGGRSITSLMSTAKQGTISRIVPQLEKGTVVEIPLTYVDYLVTEYGMVNLDGKTRRERAEAIISIAHPDFQPELRRAAQKLFWP